jgi:hypothetical protein
MSNPTLANPGRSVNTPQSHEACGHYAIGKFGWRICRLLLWANGEAVACQFYRNSLPCPIAEKVHGLEATLARAEALPEKWRENGQEFHEEVSTFRACADELDAALHSEGA